MFVKHVDRYLREREAAGAGASELALVSRTGALLVERSREQLPPAAAEAARRGQSSQLTPTPQPDMVPSAPSRGPRIGRLVWAALMLAVVVRYKDVGQWLLSQRAGSQSFAQERAALPNIAQPSIAEDDAKARECMGSVLLAKTPYVSARAVCFGDPEARRIEETPEGARMNQAQFERYLREESKRRGGDAGNGAAMRMEVELSADDEEGDYRELRAKIRFRDGDGRVVAPIGSLRYKLVRDGGDGESVTETEPLRRDSYAASGDDRWAELRISLPNAKKGETRVDVQFTFDERLLVTERYSF